MSSTTPTQPQSFSTGEVRSLVEALAGRYEIGRELGRGGMATVFLARDVRHQRDVALKVFQPDWAAFLGADRFRREIELAAGLSHPHILPVHDSGEAEGFLFFVMPYVRGESLRQHQRNGPLPVAEVIDIAEQVSAALAYAHAQGIVHRDIKPENILLHEGMAVVADFGIALCLKAAAAGDRLTQAGLSLGTPEYMSPEQALGEQHLDGRSDIYSLGCVIYELLSGEPPFSGSALSVITRKLTDPPPDVRRLRPEVPVSVCRALCKALAREPEERFATVREFAAALRLPAAATRPTTKSVAVLPFRNLSADPENEYFADGITEDIIAQLSKVRALRVLSRASVMHYKGRDQSLRDIAARLDATAIVDGSVRRIGDRVRIVAELIDPDADRHLWAETYDRQLTDVFAIQSDVALRIAAALEAELTVDEKERIAREPTRNVKAYQLLLQGRHCFLRFTAEGIQKSLWFFQRALDLDPRYAAAHAGIAMSYFELAEIGALDAEHAYGKAADAAQAALALDPDLSEAFGVLGSLSIVRDYDWGEAERLYQRAIELNPNNADAFNLYNRLCSALGRFDEAVELAQKSHQLDPLAHRADLPTSLLRAGRFAEALEETQRALEVDPVYDRLHATLGWALLRNGRTEEGLAALEQACALAPTNLMWRAQLGQAYAESGRAQDAQAILAELRERAATDYVPPYYLGYVLTGLGEHDAAIDMLEEAYEQRAGAVYGIRGSFLFTALHEHPRFKALLKRMNIN